jgi:tetratricopeptide (TPR) repeat protein
VVQLAVLITGLSLTLSGCTDDFLSPDPKTTSTSASFFEKEDHFSQSLNGAYASLQDFALQSHVLLEGRSDNTTYDNGLNRGVLRSLVRIDAFVMRSDEAELSSVWNTLYTGIKDVNLPLSELDAAVENGVLDSDQASRFRGELRFLRGYFYFSAVRLWGNIPLITEPFTTGLSTFEIEQSPKEEVYNTIVQDLESAESLLPANYNASNLGRPTSWAAKALLSKVYLKRGQYANAEETLREVIDSGRFSLLQDYSSIFEPQNKFNAEIIYSVPFKQGSEGESSNFIFQFAPVGSFPEVIPTLVGDGTWGKNLPTRQLVSTYSSEDKRKDASIGVYQPQGDSIFYVKKWDEATNEEFARTDHNWPLIRYADVLLLMAEAINEQGGRVSDALNYVNTVRNRADLNDTTATNQSELRDIILHERRLELAFENKRWFDLVRNEKFVEVMREHGDKLRNNPPTEYTQTTPFPNDAFNIEEHMAIYPIPQNEIISNENMEQNPGY